MGEIVNISKYPEGLDILAEKLELPIPKENMEARKNFIKAAILQFVNF